MNRNLTRRQMMMSSAAASTAFVLSPTATRAENPQSGQNASSLNLFLFAGQSNMAGADSVVAEPPGFQQLESDRSARFACTALPQGEKSSAYYPWGDIRGHRHSPTGKLIHGPEVGFARALYDSGWRDIAVIKVFGNFRRDVKDWPWSPGGQLFEAWHQFVEARLADLKTQNRPYQVRGFIWHQGIDDAIHGELAGRYQQNLAQLIAVLRMRYANADAPFVLARSVNSPIARSVTGSGENDPMAVVRRAQVAITQSIRNTGWIDVDDLPNVNRHHFTADGQLAIGKRFAERFLAVCGS